MIYQIETADNGWIVSWMEEYDDGRYVRRAAVFETPDNIDTMREDPQSLLDLLFFVKHEVCGQYYSKHKRRNIMIELEGGEDDQS